MQRTYISYKHPKTRNSTYCILYTTAHLEIALTLAKLGWDATIISICITPINQTKLYLHIHRHHNTQCNQNTHVPARTHGQNNTYTLHTANNTYQRIRTL